jgi:hypothetical protein
MTFMTPCHVPIGAQTIATGGLQKIQARVSISKRCGGVFHCYIEREKGFQIDGSRTHFKEILKTRDTTPREVSKIPIPDPQSSGRN